MHRPQNRILVLKLIFLILIVLWAVFLLVTGQFGLWEAFLELKTSIPKAFFELKVLFQINTRGILIRIFGVVLLLIAAYFIWRQIHSTGRRSLDFVHGLANQIYRKRWPLFLGATPFLAFVLWKILEWQLSPSNFQERKDLIQLVAQIVGGAVLLIGIFLTWRRIEVAREGQITERFTRAIEQLSSDNLELRLGGIYALERIAKDSEKDHWPIMEILTTYVRKNAPQKWEEENEDQPLVPPCTDIQAILTVLGRRRWIYEKGEEQRLDLYSTNLRLARLIEAHLERAIFLKSNLCYADFTRAHLEGADLRESWLNHTILTGAHLEGANLSGIRLNDATLTGAHLEGADLTEIYWTVRARFKGAHMNGTDLRGTNLKNAIDLTREQINVAIIDEETKLPHYLLAAE